jgi:hypothetical protein
MREVKSMSESESVEAGSMQEPAESPTQGHPAEVAFFGFVAGVVDVLVVPGVFVTAITNFWKHAQFNVLSLGLATLFLPMVLLVPRKTRRFAECMILGGAVTAFAVATVVVVLKALLNS